MELSHLQVPKRLEIADQRWFEGFVGDPDDVQSQSILDFRFWIDSTDQSGGFCHQEILGHLSIGDSLYFPLG